MVLTNLEEFAADKCSAIRSIISVFDGVENIVGTLNGVLRRFQQYFSHIMAAAYIIHIFPVFHQYKAGALKYLAQGQSHKKTRGSGVARI